MATLRKTFIFLAVLGASIAGGVIFGISVSKLFLIPLVVFLLITNRKIIPLTSTGLYVALFFLLYAFSSLIGFIAPVNTGSDYTSILVMNLLSVVFLYFPLIYCFNSYKNRKRIYREIVSSIVIVIRIHLVWALAQFLLYYFASFDLNTTLLSWLLERPTTLSYNPMLNMVFIRATGISSDPAFLGILMVLGYIFDKKRIMTFLYFVTVLLAMSRLAILAFAVLFVAKWYLRGSARGKFFTKASKRALVLFGIAIVVFIILYFTIPVVSSIVTHLFSRFDVSDVGSSRHIIYITQGFVVNIAYYPFLLFKLFGMGPRTGGTAFAVYYPDGSIFDYGIVPNDVAWAVESDAAEIVLGQGLVGFVLYIAILIELLLKGNREAKLLSIALIVTGLLYNMSAQPIVQFILIASIINPGVVFANAKKRRKVGHSIIATQKQLSLSH